LAVDVPDCTTNGERPGNNAGLLIFSKPLSYQIAARRLRVNHAPAISDNTAPAAAAIATALRPGPDGSPPGTRISLAPPTGGGDDDCMIANGEKEAVAPQITEFRVSVDVVMFVHPAGP
jgi:hypothetical protein